MFVLYLKKLKGKVPHFGGSPNSYHQAVVKAAIDKRPIDQGTAWVVPYRNITNQNNTDAQQIKWQTMNESQEYGTAGCDVSGLPDKDLGAEILG